MSRWEFMRQLEELLFDISPNEREEALQYYNDYFNDAGRENEKEVIEALGSPQQVAKIVKDGLSENACQGEFTENGFTSTDAAAQNAIVKRQEKPSDDSGHAGEKTEGKASADFAKESDQGGADSQSEKKEAMPAWAIVLMIIGGILLSPVIFAAVCAAGGTLIGLIAALLGIILGLGAAMLVLFVIAIALFVGGFGCILVHPAAGIGLLGGGCVCMALGILFMLLVYFIAGKCVPGICQGISYIFKKLFGDKGGAKA